MQNISQLINEVEQIYNLAKKGGQLPRMRACIRYLLHYQHYNAEFSAAENTLLNYPEPLIINEKYKHAPIYTRHYAALKNIADFVIRSRTIYSVIAANSSLHPNSALGILKNFYDERDVVVKKLECTTLEQTEFSNFTRELKYLDLNRSKKIICYMPISFNCIIIWGAKWGFEGDRNKLEFLNIDSLLAPGLVFSTLVQSGATLDRITMNKLATEWISLRTGFEQVLEKFTITRTSCDNNTANKWTETCEKIKTDDLTANKGCEIYRDAILRWALVISENELWSKLATPLLNSQVLPFLQNHSNLAYWSKGYQNLCEIIMFCLDYYSDNIITYKLQTTMLSAIDPKGYFANENKEAALYPYAMSAVSDILAKILANYSGRNLKIACIERNYFEMTELLSKHQKRNVEIIKKDKLSDIDIMPDVLMIDIHPNNASRDLLFANDIARWVSEKLDKNSNAKLKLILDLTLNDFNDSNLKALLQSLKMFVAVERLEIFIIQSLAKLMQLGADNFSAGLCFYLGNKYSKYFSNLPQQNHEKEKFFALLASRFQDLNTRYITLIRENTNFVYEELTKLAQAPLQDSRYQFKFMKVGLNYDESTVYVVLDFAELLSDKYIELEKLRAMILKLARFRNLPLTGRQSFGFPLSNITTVGAHLRWSIGVENQSDLRKYIELIADICFAISKVNNFDQLEWLIHRSSYTWFFNVKKYKQEYLDDDPFDDNFKLVEDGFVQIEFSKKNFVVYDDKRELGSEQIGAINHAYFATETHRWSDSDKFRLWFKLCVDHESLYFCDDAIGGLFYYTYSIRNLDPQKFRRDDLSISFHPFSIVHNNIRYDKKSIFVKSSDIAIDTVDAIRFGKLPKLQQEEIVSKIASFQTKVTSNYNSQKSILLSFTQRRASVNYYRLIHDHRDNLKQLNIVLNQLYSTQLFPPDINSLTAVLNDSHEEHKFSPQDLLENPKSHIFKVLEKLGIYLLYNSEFNGRHDIQDIQNNNFKVPIIIGVIENLAKACFDRRVTEDLARRINNIIVSNSLGNLINKCFLSNLVIHDLRQIKPAIENNPHLVNYFIALESLIILNREEINTEPPDQESFYPALLEPHEKAFLAACLEKCGVDEKKGGLCHPTRANKL